MPPAAASATQPRPRRPAGFQRCREVFQQADENRDGLVDSREFIQHCSLFGLSPEDALIRDIFDAADMVRVQLRPQ